MKNGSSEAIGAILVIGGGISGIQSALDLASTGYKVYGNTASSVLVNISTL